MTLQSGSRKLCGHGENFADFHLQLYNVCIHGAHNIPHSVLHSLVKIGDICFAAKRAKYNGNVMTWSIYYI